MIITRKHFASHHDHDSTRFAKRRKNIIINHGTEHFDVLWFWLIVSECIEWGSYQHTKRISYSNAFLIRTVAHATPTHVPFSYRKAKIAAHVCQFISYCCTFDWGNIPRFFFFSFFSLPQNNSIADCNSVSDWAFIGVCIEEWIVISFGIHCCSEIITSKTEIINYNDSNGSIVHVFLCDWTANRKRNKLIRSFRFFCFPQ